jgi:hypothetical protein
MLVCCFLVLFVLLLAARSFLCKVLVGLWVGFVLLGFFFFFFVSFLQIYLLQNRSFGCHCLAVLSSLSLFICCRFICYLEVLCFGSFFSCCWKALF